MKQPYAPFKRVIILGDSNAYGMCAGRPENEWPQVVVELLRKFQDTPIELINQAIPSNVISPRCPGYERTSQPSLVERYQDHCISLMPDLVIIAQSLNDMRLGMPIQDYLKDLEQIVTDILQKTGALIVLLGVYHQVYGQGFNDPAEYPWATMWDFDVMQLFNRGIDQIAKRLGVLFVDVQDTMQGVDWLLHPDGCHMNDLGHVLVGNAVFQTLAVHCRFLADRVYQSIISEGVSVNNTGGTNASETVKQAWKMHTERFPDVLEKE